MRKMKVAVIGCGGVGGYFGGKLAAAGHDVTLVARGKHLEAIRERGLRIMSIAGGILIEGANATDDLASMGRADIVILGVKTWQVREAAGQVGPRYHCILPMELAARARAKTRAG